MIRIRFRFSALLVLFFMSGPAFAWIYPEHRDITMKAITMLNPERRKLLDKLWQSARTGYESRLCPMVITPEQGFNPGCLDFAAWPAIGGDHSKSSADMINNILHTEWILKVANIAARLKVGLEQSGNRSDRQNKLRDSDIKLLRADPEYVSRAGANNGHFMLALPDVNISASSYFSHCYQKGSDLNTVGTYIWYHSSALKKACGLNNPELTPEQRSALILSALADEAFALHFLEDSFTSGHIAGIWGNASMRKGTHDYYNEKGLEVYTWLGVRMVLMGDAYMQPGDEEVAARCVALSLSQLLDAASGAILNDLEPDPILQMVPDTFNVSKTTHMPESHLDERLQNHCHEVLVFTPVPGLATGKGELPRFRAELGPFIGIAPAVRGYYLNGGFCVSQTTPGVVPGLDLSIRFGLGMEGVLNESGDGLVFLDLGWRIDGTSSMRFDDDPILKNFGSYASALPSRDAYYARVRLPFCLVPGDLLVTGPFLLIFSPKTLNRMIVAAGNGGLVPWQSGILTPIGRFQFVLGREIGVTLYGTGQGPDAFLMEQDGTEEDQKLISLYTTQLDFPILEYRPLRTYSSRQSASLVLQVLGGVDLPGKRASIFPENASLPEVKPVWFIGLRLAFDWRYYFTGNKL